MNLNVLDKEILGAIAQHGPLTFDEVARATHRPWSVINAAIDRLHLHGFVLLLADHRVRVTAVARIALEEAKSA
jgi:predicted transcriptional regulator